MKEAKQTLLLVAIRAMSKSLVTDFNTISIENVAKKDKKQQKIF